MQKSSKIRVLKVFSGTKSNSPFKEDQNRALVKHGIHLDLLEIKKGGFWGYTHAIKQYIGKVKRNEYDIIHTHDIAAIISIFQSKASIIMSFHGSDLKNLFTRILCNFASIFSTYRLLSNETQEKYLFFKGNHGILNSGIDLDIFYPINKDEARKKMSLNAKKKIILFGGSISNSIKNYPLAISAINMLKSWDLQIIELKGYSRRETMLLYNASDLLLVTSKSETGPNVTKEALACNLPVISTNVGHPRIITLLENIEGCFVTSYNPNEIATSIEEVLMRSIRVDSRDSILGWDINKFAKKTIDVYNMVINRRKNNRFKLYKIVFPE